MSPAEDSNFNVFVNSASDNLQPEKISCLFHQKYHFKVFLKPTGSSPDVVHLMKLERQISKAVSLKYSDPEIEMNKIAWKWMINWIYGDYNNLWYWLIFKGLVCHFLYHQLKLEICKIRFSNLLPKSFFHDMTRWAIWWLAKEVFLENFLFG